MLQHGLGTEQSLDQRFRGAAPHYSSGSSGPSAVGPEDEEGRPIAQTQSGLPVYGGRATPCPTPTAAKTPTPKTWGHTADAFAFGEDYGVPEHEDADEEVLLQDGESGDGASHPLDTPAGWTQESPVREISAIEPARLINSCGIAATIFNPAPLVTAVPCSVGPLRPLLAFVAPAAKEF